ncbi:hypothetical protein SESBI_30188 [Sesbania bispinosa]|nr:hypothetical protein SESBI_30188 [Sesbania bispinosa]
MTKQSKGSKLMRYMKAPLRFLIKARDMYVQGMIHWSGHLNYVDAAMGCPTGQLATIPRSFSVNSATRSKASDDDFKELIRAASLRSYGNRVDLGSEAMKVPRSRSVGIGRIKEDEPYDFGDDANVKPLICPRSRSYAIRRGAALF